MTIRVAGWGKEAVRNIHEINCAAIDYQMDVANQEPRPHDITGLPQSSAGCHAILAVSLAAAKAGIFRAAALPLSWWSL